MSDRLKVLMMGDMGLGHHMEHVVPIYDKLFADSGFDFKLSDDRDLFKYDNLKSFNTVVVYTGPDCDLTAEQSDGLLNCIAGGTGFVGLHSAADSFHNRPAYERMVGGVFMCHPGMRSYTYKVTNHNHPIMQGVDDFVAPEELYLMETSGEFEVLLSIYWNGFERPMAWVKPYGHGRVFYTALGHGKEQHDGAMFRRMIVNAVRWTGSVER